MIIKGTNLYINTATGAGMSKIKSSSSVTATPFSVKRNDKLDLSELFQKYTKADDSKKAGIRQMLLEISEEDKLSDFEKAKKCYSEMRRLIRSEISGAKQEVKNYNKLMEEKQYYQDMLDRCNNGETIMIEEDKYSYLYRVMDDSVQNAASSGNYTPCFIPGDTVVSENDIQAAIDYIDKIVQEHLISKYCPDDSLDERYRNMDSHEFWQEMKKRHSELHDDPDVCSSEEFEMLNDIVQERNKSWKSRAYDFFASEFASVTGISVPHSGSGWNNPMFSKEGYTIENFVQKTEERLDLLYSCDKALKESMKNYLQKEKALEAYLPEKNIIGELTIFFREKESETELLDEFFDSIFPKEKN